MFSRGSLCAESPLEQWEQIPPQLQTLLGDRFSIGHSTLQPESVTIRQICDAGPDCGTGDSRQIAKSAYVK